MKKIQILGTGCAKCEKLYKMAAEAVQELGMNVEITKVTDIAEITSLGVMMTPAMLVDGKVVVMGRVPSLDETKKMIE
ncbi:MAG: thioredoxin family protein [Thermoguttaceae bacterium]